MSAGFTPGPWHVGNGDIFADGNASTDHDDIVIAAIGKSGGFRSHEYAVVKAHKPEGRANARLIAAAPDLYRVAELLVDWLDEEPGAHKLCDVARAALAKVQS